MPVVWNADNDARVSSFTRSSMFMLTATQLLMAYIEATDAKLGTDGWKAIAEKLGGGEFSSLT